MLARATTLVHPSGANIETPLLIPSFSSKGFGISRTDTASELERIFSVAAEFLTDSMLLSAYDTFHALLPQPSAPLTDITIVDSGGYETSDHVDLTSTFIQPIQPLPWDRERHLAELDKWPAHVPAVFVTYDDGTSRISLEDQIVDGRALLKYARTHLIACLIKPETTKQKYVQTDNIVALADQLGCFNIVGLTEKELGSSALDRMATISKVRRALDDADVKSPIHIFGCLDPITVPLYFLAGAEIFDGLSWLRYGFSQDVTMYRHNSAALDIGIHRTDDFVKMKTMQENLSQLVDLRLRLRRFLVTQDLASLGRHAKLFRDALDSLSTKVGGVA